MAANNVSRLNDSGEDSLACIFDRGALHHSRGQSTSLHSHYAWKLHIGLDAPVWLEGEDVQIGNDSAQRVVVVPPGVEHRTGAIGWSLAVFLAPGSRELPWRADNDAFALSGESSKNIVALCKEFDVAKLEMTPDFTDELAAVTRSHLAGPRCLDSRVEVALRRLSDSPQTRLQPLAKSMGLSLD